MPDSQPMSRATTREGSPPGERGASRDPADDASAEVDGATRRIAVVIGMHRSGTSVLTRAVAALGFDLGDDLLPPRVPDNPTGYWEDRAFVDFNDELLGELGCLWWQPGVDANAVAALGRDEHWIARAASLIDERFAERRTFAVKDPRMSRLLRFWLPVFRRCGVDDRYVLSVRNPLEIARSLARRDLPFGNTTSYMLSAEHLFMPLVDLEGRNAFVVDYEAMLDSPRPVLGALARFLGLGDEAAANADVETFCAQFVEAERRRERASAAEFEADPEAPVALVSLYRMLCTHHGETYAVPEGIGDTAPFVAWQGLACGLRFARHPDMSPAATAASHGDPASDARSDRVQELERTLAESRDESAAMRARVEAIEAERAQGVEREAAARRALEVARADASARAQQLEQELTDRAQRIGLLEKSLYEWEERATRAEREARALDVEAELVHAELAHLWWVPRIRALRKSLGRTPAKADTVRIVDDDRRHPVIAALARFFRYRRSRLILVAGLQVESTRDGFRSLGDDPQLAVTTNATRLPQGWCRLRYRAQAVHAHLQPKLYVDTGNGFNELSTIRLPFATGRDQRVFVRLPPANALRLDPCDSACEFTFSDIDVTELGHLAVGIRAAANVITRTFTPPGASLRRIAFGWRMLRTHGFEAFRGQFERALADAPDYDEWVAMFDTPTAASLRLHRERVASLARKPLVSIILPVLDTPERLLRECIDSVLAQTYPHWELCVADDASTLAHVAPTLARYAKRDARIRVVTRSERGHISAASNSALDIATGEFVAFLDHDDVLAPHALSCMIERLQSAEYDLAYSDEDHIDHLGRRYEPFFKPDWNPDLLTSVNYVCHFTLARRRVIEKVGRFRPGFEGAQDFDLFLRICGEVPPGRIQHVPRVLYHWRAVAGSTALSTGEKSYAESAGLAALREHLAAIGADAVAMPGSIRTTYRVRWRVPQPQPLVSIIIPTRDRVDLLRACIDSIRERTLYRPYEIIIVDNESRQPETLAYLRDIQQLADVRVLRHEGPFNFSAINNRAVAAAAGSIVALVNNDIEVIDAEWLDEMVSQAARPEIGAVGAKLLYRDRHVQHAGLILGVHRIAGHAFRHLAGDEGGANGRAMMTQSLSAVTGACLVVRKTVYEQVGGFDEVDLKVAFNDVDFCIKVMKAGYRNLFTPYARLYHVESASRGIDVTDEKFARFSAEVETMLARWSDTLANDPAYNPNLTLVAEDFSLAWPPRVEQ